MTVRMRPFARHGSLPYRPEIDGLRATAVAAVVLYHLGAPFARGGYVGVDVFFVISGYLMASLVKAGFDAGTFSLSRFYERRIRRIFPALFVVVAASAIAAWFLFMPLELEYFGRAARATALFAYNFLLTRESGYFDLGAQSKPLLHLWSLGVEEQFYIVFPLLMMALARWGRKWTVPGLLFLTVASFGASAWRIHAAPVAVFYLPQFRCWELLLGGLLAFTVLPPQRRRRIDHVLSILGLCLIVGSAWLYDGNTVFPGPAALIPCLGAAIIIATGAQGGPVYRLLAAAPVRFVGRLSYSLYLWHWPLIVFARYRLGRELTAGEAVLLVTFALGLSYLSWRFIEEPSRHRKLAVGIKPIVVAASAAVAGVIAFASFVEAENGASYRLAPAARRIYQAGYETTAYWRPSCFSDPDGDGPSLDSIRSGQACTIGASAEANHPSFLVWGDSHAAAMAPAIEAAARRFGRSGLFVGDGGCPPIYHVDVGNERKNRRCTEFNEAVRALIAERRIPVVFLIAFWPKYIHRTELPNEGLFYDPSIHRPLDDWSKPVARSLDETLADFKHAGRRAVLVMDVPEIGYAVTDVLAKAASTGVRIDIAPSLQSVAERQALSRRVLTAYAAKYHAELVDPTPALCDGVRCEVERNGIPLYRDADHLSTAGARSISYLFDACFRDIAAPQRHLANAASDPGLASP